MHLIVNGIRKFSTMSRGEKEYIDVNEIINESLLLLSKQLANCNIKLKKGLSENIPKVYANASQIQQVFVNMISNSKDALESKGGGNLTVKSALSGDGKCAEVSFKDTGCGIRQENLSKLFHPFFTTKDVGKGTGLGLSITHGIVTSLGGKINVASKQGKGSSFEILLPHNHNNEGAL